MQEPNYEVTTLDGELVDHVYAEDENIACQIVHDSTGIAIDQLEAVEL